MSYVNFLIQLTERDKRLLIALFIIFIVVFVLIAYIGQGVKSLMKRYGKGIDGYMHDLCKAKLVKNPKEFVAQVYKKETRVLYLKMRWACRIGLVISGMLILYAFVFRKDDPGSFAFFNDAMNDLKFGLTWPKDEFFGIKNFPVDWPVVSKYPSPKFEIASIITYLSVIGYIYVGFVIVTSTMRFIARLNRARVKSVDVFTKSLDKLDLGDELDEAK